MTTIRRAVITGATGMLGATLTRELIEQGVSVLAIARPASPKRANIPDHPLVRVLECPLEELGRIGEQAETYDVLYHFAWDGTYGARRDDVYLQNANVRATLDAVALAKRLGCAAFVGAGSQAEYGRAEGKLTVDTPANPTSGYGIAKLAAFRLGKLYAEQLGLRFTWARFLSVYGPMDNDYTLTMGTIVKLLRGEETHFTKGEQQWDFLYSEDAARALRLLGERGRHGLAYPVGSGRTVPLREAVETLCHLLAPGARVGLGDMPYWPNQVMYLCADIEPLRRDTGFAPTTPLPEGLNKTIAWRRRREDK